MRRQNGLWLTLIAILLLGLTVGILYLLRRVIKYYWVPETILKSKHNLIIFNSLMPLIPAMIIVNHYLSKKAMFARYFNENEMLYPISMFGVFVLLVICTGLAIEYGLKITNSNYAKYVNKIQ